MQTVEALRGHSYIPPWRHGFDDGKRQNRSIFTIKTNGKSEKVKDSFFLHFCTIFKKSNNSWKN